MLLRDENRGMKRVLLIFAIFLLSLCLTGCWDRIEINDIGLVTGLGMDLDDKNQLELIAEIHIPKNLGGNGGTSSSAGPQTFIRTGIGKTIADAISNLQEKLPREAYWGQTKVIVIGEKLARQGIRVPMDFLVRHPKPRLRAHVFVADCKAKDVLRLNPPLERSASEVLRELSNSEVLMDVTLKKMLQMLTGEGQAAAVPMVSILPPEKQEDPLRTIGYIRKTAIFKQDKMVGSINDKLTRGVLWMRNEIKRSNISVKPHEGAGYISSVLLRGNSKLIPLIEGDKWKMTVKAVTEDDIIVNGSNLDLMNPEVTRELEKDLEKYLQLRMAQATDKVQKVLKADVLGFSEEFHRKYPKEWNKAKKNWNEIFPAIEVNYDIEAKIRRPGLATTPQGIPKDEVKEQ